jgi:hypothetical protein
MRLTIQDMISGAIAEATEREKLARPKEQNSLNAQEDRKEVSINNNVVVSTDVVEKVASAIEYIGSHLNLIDWEKVAVGEPLAPQEPNAPQPKVGPGVGPGSILQTNIEDPTLGLQSDRTGQATDQNQPEPAGKKDDVGNKDGQTNPDTALFTNMAHVPGGTGEQSQLKQASINAVRALWGKVKQAADGEDPAQINAGSEPPENPNASASEEGVPKLPGPAQAQANLVQTKDPTAPINITKGQAKAEPKRQMGEVLDEPAQKKSTDPVLHENLDATSGAGVKISSLKIAAARSYLRKIAQAEKKEDATPEEKKKAEKLKETLSKKSQMMPTAGSALMPSALPPTMPSPTM